MRKQDGRPAEMQRATSNPGLFVLPPSFSSTDRCPCHASKSGSPFGCIPAGQTNADSSLLVNGSTSVLPPAGDRASMVPTCRYSDGRTYAAEGKTPPPAGKTCELHHGARTTASAPTRTALAVTLTVRLKPRALDSCAKI